MRTVLHLSCHIYGALILCYPPDLRRQFDSEMTQVFADQLAKEWRCRGVAGVVRVWRTALLELFSVAVPLRLQSPVAIAVALSLLGSAALCMAFLRAVSR
jgi:hypothetical protein